MTRTEARAIIAQWKSKGKKYAKSASTLDAPFYRLRRGGELEQALTADHRDRLILDCYCDLIDKLSVLEEKFGRGEETWAECREYKLLRTHLACLLATLL